MGNLALSRFLLAFSFAVSSLFNDVLKTGFLANLHSLENYVDLCPGMQPKLADSTGK